MANAVASFVDGVGNRVDAIQWDGDPGTWTAIQAWTKKAFLNRRGTMCVQTPSIMLHVAIGQWLVMDSNHALQLFPMTGGQFNATYRPGETAQVAAAGGTLA